MSTAIELADELSHDYCSCLADYKSRGMTDPECESCGTKDLRHRAAAELRRLAVEADTLRADADECDALRAKLADTLTRTAEALKGPPPPLHAWGWHDLPEIAEALRAERDSVLSDWNALVSALGSPTNGGAVGHARALRAEVQSLTDDRDSWEQQASARTADAVKLAGERDLARKEWAAACKCLSAANAEVNRLTRERASQREADLEVQRETAEHNRALQREVERLRSGEPLSLLSAIIAELDDEPPHGPGHSHSKAGVWDCDNQPALAGKPCDWCATWDKARTLVAEATKEQQENAS